MLQTWSEDPFAHAYFVVAAAAYLAWSLRERVESMNPRPAFAALPLLGVLSFLWLSGNLVGSTQIQQFSLVTMVVATAWAVLGTAATRALMFPLGLLLFALPFGERLAPTLQDFTARFALKLLTLSGVHPVLEGHAIFIGLDRWRVTEACGGINYLTASMAVGYLYAGAAYRQWGHRAAFFVASALVPVAANGLRVYTTILLDYRGATRVVEGMGHYMYGVLVFGIVMSILFVTCGRWREEPSGEDDRLSFPQRAESVVPLADRHRIVLCAALAMSLVAIGPVSGRALRLPPGLAGTIPQNPPAVLMPWKAVDLDPPARSPRVVTPHTEFLQSYRSGDHVVMLHVAQYGADQPEATLAGGGSLLFDKPWWSAGERHRAIVLEGTAVQVNEGTLRSPQSSVLVWNWYEIDGGVTGNRYLAKLLLAKARLLRSRRGSAAIAVATEEQPGVDAAAVLSEFVQRLSFSASPLATRSYSSISTAALAALATASTTAIHTTTR